MLAHLENIYSLKVKNITNLYRSKPYELSFQSQSAGSTSPSDNGRIPAKSTLPKLPASVQISPNSSAGSHHSRSDLQDFCFYIKISFLVKNTCLNEFCNVLSIVALPPISFLLFIWRNATNLYIYQLNNQCFEILFCYYDISVIHVFISVL